jgi:hypothetical protein
MIRGVGRLDHVLRVVRATVSKGVKRDYVRVVEAYPDDAGKTQHRTVINFVRQMFFDPATPSAAEPVGRGVGRGSGRLVGTLDAGRRSPVRG